MSLLRKELRIQEGKYIHKFDVGLKVDDDHIWFQQVPFSKILNRAIKTFSGYKWHGYAEPPIKKWSVKNCPRNVFQLRYLWGENVYEWWQQPLIDLDKSDFNRPQFEELGFKIEPQQVDMVRRALTYHYQILGAEQGLGKSLAAIEIMERSGKKEWWFCGPKSALESVELEIDQWGLDPSIKLRMMSFEKMTKEVQFGFAGMIAPEGIFFDESSSLKNSTTNRAIAAQGLADLVREQYGFDGYVIELSGTPSAKNPSDLWSQCEIAWPGYLKEGSEAAFDLRYGYTEDVTTMDGVTHQRRIGWKEDKVAKLPGRYKGLMTVYRKKDWVNLPPKKFIKINLEPSNKVLRVAKSLCSVAPNTITALTWTRALSSGFQYVNTKVGEEECPLCLGTGEYQSPDSAEAHTCPNCVGEGRTPVWERQTRRVKTPKDDALRKLLDQTESHGRVVIAASFQGSIDRILAICKTRGWSVACVDGRGWRAYDNQGSVIKLLPANWPEKKGHPLIHFWREHEGKVAFVCNPGSARFGLTLTLAYMLIFYDNNFSAEHRLQMMDRIHRISMSLTLGATIVDLIHLPIDQFVLDILDNNKKLELISLGEIAEAMGLDDEEIKEELLEEV